MGTEIEVELLPCPFCGGEASGYPRFDDANSSTPGCYIVCHKCDVSPDGCYRKADEWAEAVTIWNTRHPNTGRV
jgi:Lar family restriction alleviation protein